MFKVKSSEKNVSSTFLMTIWVLWKEKKQPFILVNIGAPFSFLFPLASLCHDGGLCFMDA